MNGYQVEGFLLRPITARWSLSRSTTCLISKSCGIGLAIIFHAFIDLDLHIRPLLALINPTSSCTYRPDISTGSA